MTWNGSTESWSSNSSRSIESACSAKTEKFTPSASTVAPSGCGSPASITHGELAEATWSTVSGGTRADVGNGGSSCAVTDDSFLSASRRSTGLHPLDDRPGEQVGMAARAPGDQVAVLD